MYHAAGGGAASADEAHTEQRNIYEAEGGSTSYMIDRYRRAFIENGVGATATLALAHRAGFSLLLSQRELMTPPDAHPLLDGNPIVRGKGLCDPQIRVYGDECYLYATHDYSPDNVRFRMDDWWVWHSSDLVHWEKVSVLQPEQTYLKRPFRDCWATDGGTRDGKYYFYFSAGQRNIGVVTGDTPAGPWSDPLGKPMIAEGLTPTQQRDPGILMDQDGNSYIVFGTFDYYIARLNDDMITLAETPRLIQFDRKYGPYGEGKLDDKPFLHCRGNIYYLSWGCFYATSDNPYGPYQYKGSIVDKEHIAPEYQVADIFHDRHGSFFELHGQWYFICNDASQPSSRRYFRNSIISYIHYRENGDIAPIVIGPVGVGQYDVSVGPVEAEDFFKISGGAVRERSQGGFEVRELTNGSTLVYPHVQYIPETPVLKVRYSSATHAREGRLTIREGDAKGAILGHATLFPTKSWDDYHELTIPLNTDKSHIDLAFVFSGHSAEMVRLDRWSIEKRNGQ